MIMWPGFSNRKAAADRHLVHKALDSYPLIAPRVLDPCTFLGFSWWPYVTQMNVKLENGKMLHLYCLKQIMSPNVDSHNWLSVIVSTIDQEMEVICAWEQRSFFLSLDFFPCGTCCGKELLDNILKSHFELSKPHNWTLKQHTLTTIRPYYYLQDWRKKTI